MDDEQLRMALGTGRRMFKGVVRKDKIVLFLISFETKEAAWEAAQTYAAALRNLTAEKMIEYALYDLGGESPGEGTEWDEPIDADPTIDWLSRSGVGIERNYHRLTGESWSLCLYMPRERPPAD